MALEANLHILQIDRALLYWRIVHAVIDRASDKLHIHVWGYADHAARAANDPSHVIRWEVPRAALADFDVLDMNALYALVRERAPLPNLPFENYLESPFRDAVAV